MKPRPEDALRRYLSLGPQRSLQRLSEFYDADPDWGSINIQTLKRWSKRFHWQDSVREHEEKLTERVAEKAREDAAGQIIELARSFDQTTSDLLAKIRQIVGAMGEGNLEAVQILANVAVLLSREKTELERGRGPDQEKLQLIVEHLTGGKGLGLPLNGGNPNGASGTGPANLLEHFDRTFTEGGTDPAS